MRAEILAVGTELLLGDIINGNAAWLGQRFAEVGVDVARSVVVGDDLDAITDAVDAASKRADAVVITGGLGPTRDDLTRDALARAAGVPLRRDPAIEQRIRDRYSALGAPVRGLALQQADLPVGGTLLPNDRGTAPGLRIELGETAVYALPGVPDEMTAMFLAAVLPDLLERAGRAAAIVTRVLHTAAVWESVVGERLRDLDAELTARGNPRLSYLAAPAQVRVRITAAASSREEADALIEPVEIRARQLLGSTVYGVDGEELDRVVHRLLAERGATVAVAESLTGGLLGAALTNMPGSSATFRGGVTAYASELKSASLGVPAELLADRGAVDPSVAVAMAAGARDRLGATYGLGVTGVAGPDPSEGHSAGTVHVGLAGPSGQTLVHSPVFAGHPRARIRELTVVHALDVLRRHLLGLAPFHGWEDPG
ncbi:MAG: competence/damage-inducible protein A [Streptosporangiales bacterium]|nr:competence/damage-inducible protein A [Streptosporangiales bacterium]